MAQVIIGVDPHKRSATIEAVTKQLDQLGLQMEARYRLGQAHFAIGEFDQAIAIFLETIEALSTDGARIANPIAARSRTPASNRDNAIPPIRFRAPTILFAIATPAPRSL